MGIDIVSFLMLIDVTSGYVVGEKPMHQLLGLDTPNYAGFLELLLGTSGCGYTVWSNNKKYNKGR